MTSATKPSFDSNSIQCFVNNYCRLRVMEKDDDKKQPVDPMQTQDVSSSKIPKIADDPFETPDLPDDAKTAFPMTQRGGRW